MSFWEETQFRQLPWMAGTEPKVVHTFKVKLSSIEMPISKTTFSDELKEIEVEMKDIKDAEGDEIAEDGTHVVPFWACAAFEETVKSQDKQKGWLPMEYIRTFEIKPNKEGEDTEYNTAQIRLASED